jgi:hypothetical protein
MRPQVQHDPPPMPQVERARTSLREAAKAIDRAERAWSTVAVRDAIRSARFFLNEAEQDMRAPWKGKST